MSTISSELVSHKMMRHKVCFCSHQLRYELCSGAMFHIFGDLREAILRKEACLLTTVRDIRLMFHGMPETAAGVASQHVRRKALLSQHET